MLKTVNLGLRFNTRTLFSDVNLEFKDDNCYGIIGANGAGKSTFLKLLSGEIDSTSGEVILGKNERLSVLKQNHNEFNDLTVLETVIMGNSKLYKIMKEKDALYSKEDFTMEDGMKVAELEEEFGRLNGYQALAFSRIRYTDSAFHREARHREVAESVYKEFAQKGVETYKKCAEIILNNTKTNISPIEMMNLAYTVLKINDKDIDQFQFPLEEYRNGHIINKQKGWVLEWDKEPNLEAWHKFIFGENK